MKKIISILILIVVSKISWAQLGLRGNVFDEKAQPIGYATVALLEPKDSTLKFFGISDAYGAYTIKNVNAGSYLLQASYLGYQTFYKIITIDGTNANAEQVIILKEKSKTLSAVTVEADRIPIKFNKDTVEYDAAAYKNKPDAVTEDLLKKLPGVEVDRAGNIKAMGENVSTVLVDGKEFFSNDPKVATKNLPADAVKKVQVYDRKSEEEELSGMSDGNRDQTINLVLKDDKKQAIFGDVQAGYGTNNRFQSSAKIYRFSTKNQFAALGMANNINQFGFSFQDYLSFSGGMRNFGESGLTINTNSGSAPPINFGQQVNGLLSSAALGLNFSREYKKDKRFNISYLSNGVDRDLRENVYSRNFLSSSEFERNSDNTTDAQNFNNGLNFSLRNKIDSNQTLTAKANLQVNRGNTNQFNYSSNSSNNGLINDIQSIVNSDQEDLIASADAAYIRRLNSNWKTARFFADVNYSEGINYTNWNNNSTIYQNNLNFVELQDLSIRNTRLVQNYRTGATRKLFGNVLADIGFSVGNTNENLKRVQQNLVVSETKIDSLSPNFNRTYQYIRPGTGLRYNTDKLQIELNLSYEFSQLSSNLNDSNSYTAKYGYLLPLFEIEYEYKKGRRLMFQTDRRVVSPNANQLLPTVNNSNNLLLTKGNQQLKPELQSNYRINWIIFDQFSFISFFNSLNLTETRDKITWNRTIDSNLVQTLNAANVKNDYRLRASSEFSSPIRKLKINASIELAETWSRGLSYINTTENISNTYTHEITLRIDNRKKEKLDISIGTTLSLSTAMYSVQTELNNTYTNQVYFLDANYRLKDKWYFAFSADINQYSSQSFNESLSIPLLKMEISRYFFKNNRASVGISVFDILNKNTGIVRSADVNAIQETRSNIIGRYGLVSFKYRLNKFGEQNSGVKIDIRK
jgi:hypothetical protein